MSTAAATSDRLDRPVDDAYDHVLGLSAAPLTLVEYGSYACPYCRAANEPIAELRDRFGDRLRYVFRHRPVSGSDLARRAADLAECAGSQRGFWDAHVELMTRSEMLTEDDLRAVAEDLALESKDPERIAELSQRSRERVDADIESARRSGVRVTPTFFINGRRYDGPWDESSLSEALLGTLGHRVRSAALAFASWAPSTGLLLLIMTVLAVAIASSPLGPAFEELWEQYFGFQLGERAYRMSLRHWINDGLLTVFFLLVGLEIKRELTVGHLANRRAAALPIAAAIGGMAVPALRYLLVIPAGPWAMGWGVPMATDTAFAVALVVMMGRRVPVELRIFLTAAAIVDDIGAILVVAIFYSGDLSVGYLGAAAAVAAMLAWLNRSGVYRASPYLLMGLVLWFCVHEGGLHATLAGVVLAVFIPTRPPPNYRALMTQADTILAAEAAHSGEVLRHGPSEEALRTIDQIHDRLESPADRMLRTVAPRSSYFVLPLFALANAGVALTPEVVAGKERLVAAIVAGLVVGKPLGFVLLSLLAVRLGLATKPDAYNWQQVAGAGALAGIGFTMSLFIAGQSFPVDADFAAAKVAVFAASVMAAVIGVAVLWRATSERTGP
jgi:Na+:H+ antiporter, NhaA family